jgi:uncharacterized membrane protein
MSNARVARAVFATGIIALGIVGVVYGDFAGIWQAFPASVPIRHALGYASAVLMLMCGVALMVKRTEALAARALLVFFALLLLVVKLPPVLKAPLVEGSWQSMSEMLALLTGAWVLCASSVRATRLAQLVFGLALIPFGLSHFAYLNLTAPLIPAWLPFHTALAYFTGAAQVAAGLAILVNVLARLAATLEASMLSAFTVLVWVPALLATPNSPGTWSEFATSWAISGAAWVVAMSIPRRTESAASSQSRSHAHVALDRTI